VHPGGHAVFVNPTAEAQRRALEEREAAVERGAAERRAEIERTRALQRAIDTKHAAREAEVAEHMQRRREAAHAAHDTAGYTPQPAALRRYLEACHLAGSPVAKAAGIMYTNRPATAPVHLSAVQKGVMESAAEGMPEVQRGESQSL
jgi:hypothetical protein